MYLEDIIIKNSKRERENWLERTRATKQLGETKGMCEGHC